MADDVKNVLIDNWDEVNYALGEIEYDRLMPPDQFQYGICILTKESDYHPSGLLWQQTDAFGGDFFILWIFGETREEVEAQIAAVIKIADTADLSSNATYTKIELDLKQIRWDTHKEEGMPTPDNVRSAIFPLLMTKNNVSLYIS